MTLQEKLYQVQERIQKAAARSQRNPAEVTLILVTKNVSPGRIREAFEAGARDFGENRVQELLGKKSGLPSEIRWHFVGHLQRNKVKSLLGEAGLIHSLDRLALAGEIQKQGERKNLSSVEALMQVNTSGEATKSGFAPQEAEQAFEALRQFPLIRLRGLMTIGPFTQDERAVRSSFEKLASLREALKKNFPQSELTELSMGMSSDYEIAVEEGATIVRIGTAVFGERRP